MQQRWHHTICAGLLWTGLAGTRGFVTLSCVETWVLPNLPVLSSSPAHITMASLYQVLPSKRLTCTISEAPFASHAGEMGLLYHRDCCRVSRGTNSLINMCINSSHAWSRCYIHVHCIKHPLASKSFGVTYKERDCSKVADSWWVFLHCILSAISVIVCLFQWYQYGDMMKHVCACKYTLFILFSFSKRYSFNPKHI